MMWRQRESLKAFAGALVGAAILAGMLGSGVAWALWAPGAEPGQRLLPVPGEPLAVTATPGGLAVVSRTASRLTQVDPVTGATLAATDLGIDQRPHLMASQPSGATHYIAHETGRVSVVAASGQLTAVWASGLASLDAIEYAPTWNRVLLLSKDARLLRALQAESGAVDGEVAFDALPLAAAVAGAYSDRVHVGLVDGTVRTLALGTLEELSRVALGVPVVALQWAPALARLVALTDDGNLHLIDPVDDSRSAPIHFGESPQAAVVDGPNRFAYVLQQSVKSIAVVDLATLRYVGRFLLPANGNDLVFDGGRERLYVTLGGSDQVIEIDPGRAPIDTSLALNEYPVDVAVDNTHHQALLVNSGTRGWRHDLVWAVLDPFELPKLGHGIALDETAGLALAALDKGGAALIDLSAGERVGERVFLPDHVLDGVALDSARQLGLGIDAGRGALYLFDLATGAVRTTLEAGYAFTDLALHPQRGEAYLLHQADKKDPSAVGLRIVDLATETVSATVPLPNGVTGLELDAAHDRLLLSFAGMAKLQPWHLADRQPGAVIALEQPAATVAAHPRLDAALTVEPETGALAWIDLESGSVQSGFATLYKPLAMAVDARSNQALVVEHARAALRFVALPSPVPALDAIAPAETLTHSPPVTLTLTGGPFFAGASVLVGYETLDTTWVDHGTLTVELPANLLLTPATLDLQVLNPMPTPGPSAPRPFTVRAPNPVPLLHALDPDRLDLPAPPAPRNLTLVGDDFVEASVIYAGDTLLQTTFVDAQHLVATLPAALLEEPGTLPLMVVTPAPGGGTSAPLMLTLEIPGPVIEGFSPASGPIGSQVTVTGRNFDALASAGNTVTFNGAPAFVTHTSATALSVIVPLAATSGPITVETAKGRAESATPFTLLATENFGVSASHESLTLPLDGRGEVVFTLASLGLADYAQLVALTFDGLPDGVTLDLDRATLINGRPVTLTLTAGDGLAPGTYLVTVHATGEVDGRTVTRDITVELVVLPAGSTVVTGRVLHAEDDAPFVGAQVQFGDQVVTTDGAGRYLFVNPPLTGHQVLLIDGHPLNSASAEYPSRIPLPVYVTPGTTNSALTSYLSAIDPTRFTAITPGAAATVTNPDLPHYALNIPAGAVLMGHDGTPIDKVNVRITTPDRLPIRPLPEGVTARSVYLYYFFRPGGADPSEPIPVTMVNDQALAPGDKVTMWYYDESSDPTADSNRWRVMGSGTISADGKSAVSDPGVGIPKFCCGATTFTPPDPPPAAEGGDDTCLTNKKKFQPEAGNPVDLASGVGTILEDHSFGVNALFPASVSCRFQSNSERDGPFGRGTYLNYDWRLLVGSATVTVVTPRGTLYPLTRAADGTYRTDSGRAGGLGIEVVLQDGAAVLTLRSGTRLYFAVGNPFRTLLLAIEDRHGNRIDITRESIPNSTANSRVLALTDGSGGRYRFEYVTNTLIKRIIDPIGRVQSYAYDGQGRLTGVTNFLQQTTRYVWDVRGDGSDPTDPAIRNAGRIVRKIDPLERTTDFDHDADGRIVRERLPDGGEWHFAYTVAGGTVRETAVTNPRGYTTRYRFNGQGYPTRVTDALGRVTEREYDFAQNLLRKTTDPLGRAVRYFYNDRGNRTGTRVDRPDGSILLSTTQYHPVLQLPTAVTDPLQRTTVFNYHPDGALAEAINPNQEKTTFGYTPAGQLETVTDAREQLEATLRYDALGNVTAVEDALGRVARTAYDPANRPVAASDPLGRTTHTSYDALDRVTRVTGPSGTGLVLAYDAVGNLTTVTDPRNVAIERLTYDAMNRVKTRTDANDRVWSYTYDANGNLATVTDPKLQVARYVHDPLDRLVQVTDADGRVTRLTYDAAGRLARVEDSASGATVYQYDDLDRLTRELSDRGTIEYAYNDAGELTERTVNGGDPTTYAYDPAGRIKTITFRGRAVSYAYDDAGRLERKTLPNGIAQVYAFDNADQLTSLSYRDAADAEIDRIDYGYDPAGQRVLKNHEQGLANQETPLVETYDDANRMVTFNGHTLAYDANGNLTRRDTAAGPVTYTWNARNELIAIAGPHGTASFAYDHLGRRIEKTVNGITTGYLYHGAQAIAELNGASLSATYHVGLAIDEVVARYTDEGSRSLLTDALGSVVALADEGGMVSTRYGYSPYGETADAGEENDNSLKYTGREDDGTGVYYYRARYYDPELKRFISVDPIGLAGGVNVYSYVKGSPLRYADPFGLVNFLVGVGATAAAPTGGEFSGGIVVNPGLFGQQADAGVFGAIGPTVGVNVSADVFVGVVKGDISNVSGPTINQNIGIGPLSITIFHDPKTGEVIGGTIGLGPGATPVGYSGAYDITGTLTIRDALNFFRPKPESASVCK